MARRYLNDPELRRIFSAGLARLSQLVAEDEESCTESLFDVATRWQEALGLFFCPDDVPADAWASDKGAFLLAAQDAYDGAAVRTVR